MCNHTAPHDHGLTDPEIWRLARFRAAHPEVQVGYEWRARIPRQRDIVCKSLQELMNELEKRAGSNSRAATPGARLFQPAH